MSLVTVKRLAADILGVGKGRVRILDAKRAAEALTRDDVRGLVEEGVIVGLPANGVGRAKARFKQSRKQSGRRRGVGSRKGSKNIDKQAWVERVRALRKALKKLGAGMDSRDYRTAYKRIKGGYFRNKKHLVSFLKEKKLVGRNG